MSIINTTIIDNQFVFIGSHVAIQVNPTFLVLKMLHQLNVPKAIQVLLHFSTCQNHVTKSPVHN